MSSKLRLAAVTLTRNQAAAAVLCLLMAVEALSIIPLYRKWTVFGANMTHVYGGNSTEVTTPNITVCVAFASRSPPANLACHKSSRCVFASVYLPHAGGGQTEGFTCWYSQVCNYKGTQLLEHETVLEPVCPEFQSLMCAKEGMLLKVVPSSRTTCTAPFTQHAFGCMYNSTFKGTFCQTLGYCQSLGANLASPETAAGVADMLQYYYANTAVSTSTRYFVHLFKVDVVWRWPASQLKASPKGTGEWAPKEPNGVVSFAVIYPYYDAGGEFRIGDGLPTSTGFALCHVWSH